MTKTPPQFAIHYKTDGTAKQVKPTNGEDFTLEELQSFVGGYIEIVSLNDMFLVVNEEGKLNNLPVNANATALWEQVYGKTDVIVGDVLYTCKRWIN